jgi:hypothetical protein
VLGRVRTALSWRFHGHTHRGAQEMRPSLYPSEYSEMARKMGHDFGQVWANLLKSMEAQAP